MNKLKQSNHNVATTYGEQSNIVTFNMTINNDTTMLLLKLKEQEALIEKQEGYIYLLSEIVKDLWKKRG